MAVPPVKPEPTRPITARPGIAERQRDAELRGDDPVGDLPHLPGDARTVVGGDPAYDRRAEHRLEAGLQLCGQGRDLLRDIIDADEACRHERTEDREVDAARRPFDGVGSGQWDVASLRSPRRPQGPASTRAEHRKHRNSGISAAISAATIEKT